MRSIHIVTGGHGSVRLYDINGLCVVSTFHGQEVACWWISHSIILTSTDLIKLGMYHCVSVGLPIAES